MSAPTNAERGAVYGRAAIKVGTPDYGQNGDDFDGFFTDASDTIANILHALHLHPEADEIAVNAVWDRAWMHFDAEIHGED